MDLQALRIHAYTELYGWMKKTLQSEILTESLCERIAEILASGIHYFTFGYDDSEIVVEYDEKHNRIIVTYDDDEQDVYVLPNSVLNSHLRILHSARSEMMNNIVVPEDEMKPKNHFHMPPRHNVINIGVKRQPKHSRYNLGRRV